MSNGTQEFNEITSATQAAARQTRRTFLLGFVSDITSKRSQRYLFRKRIVHRFG